MKFKIPISSFVSKISMSGWVTNESQSRNPSESQQNPKSTTNKMSNPYEKHYQYQELKLQQQGDQLYNLREDCQELSISNGRKDAEIRALTELQAHTKKELEQLQKMSSIQNRELETCKDNLFQLQPVIQLTDSEILKQYDTLCQQVSNWVDNEISKFEDKSGSPGNDTRTIVDGGSTRIKRLLNNAPGAGEYLISAIIHTEIQCNFFGGNVILFGLDRSFSELLHEAEERMVKLEPKRGMFLDADLSL